MSEAQELKSRLDTIIIPGLKVLASEVGERDELIETLARLRAETVEAENNLIDLKKEFGDLDRRRALRIVQYQDEDARLIGSIAEGRKELNRLDAELTQRKAELNAVLAQINAIRARLNGGT
jgi:hypothetical protein